MDWRRGWQRWVQNPQSASWRKLLLQVHLWVGLVMGLYIILISVSGSAVVFRREISRSFMPSDHELGDALPLAIRLMEWGVDFHDNLLAGSAGRTANGVAAIFVTVLLITGAVLWWPGKARWPRSLIVPRPGNTHRFNWHLHNALGFWGFVLLFGWAVTGIYFAFPGPFEATFNSLAGDAEIYPRPGEEMLLTLIRWHFGRFGGLTVRILWVILGLIPAAMFVTGFIVWWRRRLPRPGAKPIRDEAA